MPSGNEHHREKPTGRGSSDQHGKAQASGRSNATARPHETSSSGSSHSPSGQGLASQLEQVLQQQTTSSSQQQAAPHTSSQTSQPHAAAPAQAQTQGGSKPGLPILPIVIAFVALLLFGGMGGSCMSSQGDIFGGSGGGSTSNGTASTNGTYTISQNLGTGNANDTWTVLMYVCGSDLESTSTRMGGGLATGNLVELTQAKLGNNVNYVIETGGAKRWQNDVVNPRYLERYVMENGYMTQKDRVPSASMAESSTLADFLKWGVSNYPAEHYMLVFWDHGGGSITGVCLDDLYPKTRDGASDSLTLTEIRDALKSCGTKFDVVGFDTCLMATLETAEMLEPYADYMIASEESEPGTGWDYTQWPTWLGSHPGTSGADLGTVVCETYYNKCASVRAANTATLSTIDLSKIPAVSKAFMNVSDDIALATVDSSSLRKLYQGAGKAESYGNDGMFSMNMVDLGDLMTKTSKVVGSDADKVISAIDDAVVCEVHGRSRASASGLSVYYPLQITDKNDFYRYSEITTNTPYLQFLGVMFGVYDNYDWTQFDNYISLRGEPVKESNIQIAYEQSVLRDGHIKLQVTQGVDQVAKVDLEFYVYLDQLDVLCYLGSDNDMNGSYETGEFVDNFQDDWLTIDGNYVSATLAEEGDGYNLYYVPVNLNGTRSGLIVEYDYSTNEYSVICAWDDNNVETGMAGMAGILLEEGDEIQFLFPAANVTTGNQDTIPLATMKWHDDVEIGYEGLGDGTFAFRYTITDVLGSKKATDLVFQEYKNGVYVRTK